MSDNSRQNIESSVVDICLKYKSYNALVEESRHSAAEEIIDELREKPASVQIRSAWNNCPSEFKPEEFRIELSGGGPATRIIGDLDEHAEVWSVKPQHQDWFQPWKDLPLDEEETKAVKWFANLFYYGS